MKRPPITPLLLGLLAVAACGGADGPGEPNPKVLYLGLDGSETRVKLVDVEPDPF
jgi:hypothetical protein